MWMEIQGGVENKLSEMYLMSSATYKRAQPHSAKR